MDTYHADKCHACCDCTDGVSLILEGLGGGGLGIGRGFGHGRGEVGLVIDILATC